MYSTELIWQCIKKNTSFVKKNNGFTFTSEPCNLRNKHSLKYSGLASKNSISMNLDTNTNGKLIKKIKVNKKNSGSSIVRCPKKLVTNIKLSTNIKQAKKTIASHISKRPDLLNDAICRYRRLLKARC